MKKKTLWCEVQKYYPCARQVSGSTLSGRQKPEITVLYGNWAGGGGARGGMGGGSCKLEF